MAEGAGTICPGTRVPGQDRQTSETSVNEDYTEDLGSASEVPGDSALLLQGAHKSQMSHISKSRVVFKGDYVRILGLS